MRIALLTTDARGSLVNADLPKPVFGTAPEALLQGFASLQRKAEVHVLSCFQVPITPVFELAPNIFFHALHVPKIGWMRTAYQGCIRATRKKLRELQPDIIHGQGTERDCAISAVHSGYPNIITIHGNMRLIARVNKARPFTYQWLASRLERWTIPRSDGVVCITAYTQRAVGDLARQTWIVPNAVDKSFFDLPHEPQLPKTVLCVGTIQHRKNQNRFIRALEPLAATSSFRVLFLGAADESDAYAREFFSLIKSRPWCVYGGTAPRIDLQKHLSGAAVLALPSLEDNCPMTVLEAMAAGVPVLAANVGGVPELIENGRNGLLCDPLDKTSTSEGMRRLLFDSSLSARLATEAKRDALQRFHPQVIACRHLEIYEEVLSSRRSRM